MAGQTVDGQTDGWTDNGWTLDKPGAYCTDSYTCQHQIQFDIGSVCQSQRV